MGKATILQSLGGGKYRVRVDFDNNPIKLKRDSLTEKITELTTKVAEQEVEAAEKKQIFEDSMQAIIDYAAARTGEEIAIDPEGINSLILDSYRKRVDYDLTNIRTKSIEAQKLQAEKELARLNKYCPDNIEAVVWCVEPNEDLTGEIATIEVDYGIRRITNTQQIMNDTGFWLPATATPPTDVLQHPMAGSEYTTWYNACLHPMMQKWKPKYRIAIVSNLNKPANSCDLTFEGSYIFPQFSENILSDKVMHPVSGGYQRVHYTGATVDYSFCNANAFENGDKVIVDMHLGEGVPTVIGFYENPKECVQEVWPSVTYQIIPEYDSATLFDHGLYLYVGGSCGDSFFLPGVRNYYLKIWGYASFSLPGYEVVDDLEINDRVTESTPLPEINQSVVYTGSEIIEVYLSGNAHLKEIPYTYKVYNAVASGLCDGPAAISPEVSSELRYDPLTFTPTITVRHIESGQTKLYNRYENLIPGYLTLQPELD